MVNTPYVQGRRDVSWTKKDSFSRTITPEGCPFTLHPETLLFNVSSSLAPPLCVFFSQETSGLRLLEFSKWNRGRFHRGMVMFLRAKPSWIWKLFCLFFVMFYGFYYGKSPCFTIIWYEYFWIFSQPPYASKSKVKFLWKSLPPKNGSSADATWLAAASVAFRLGESGILFDKQVDQRGIWRRQGSTPTHASICRGHEGEQHGGMAEGRELSGFENAILRLKARLSMNRNDPTATDLTRAAVEVDMDTLGSQKTTCWPLTKDTNPQVSKGDPFGDDIRLSNSDSEIANEKYCWLGLDR